MKYNIGDKVIIVKKSTRNMNGKMDKHLGTIMTIKKVNYNEYNNDDNSYIMEEDNGMWNWQDDMIEGLATQEIEREEPKYRKVYVSDYSVEDALVRKQERILIYELPGKKIFKFITINKGYEEDFIKGEEYETSSYRFIAEIPQEEKVERKLMLTDSEWIEVKNILKLK